MDIYKNLALAQVITPPSPPTTGTSLTLQPGGAADLPAAPFTIVVFDGTAYATAHNAELIRVTAIVGDTLAGLVRAIEGSTARAILAGDYVAQTFTAAFVADLRDSGNQNAGILPDARLSANVPRLDAPLNAFTGTVTAASLGGTPIDASHITGTVPDSNLSTNVARLNAPNVFSHPQQSIVAGGPQLLLRDITAPVDQTVFRCVNYGGILYFQALTDDQAVAQGSLYMDRAGGLVASSLRTTPLNASQLTTGTVPDARLSSNVALKNIQNLFTSGQAFDTQLSIGGSAGYARLVFNDLTQPVNSRTFDIVAVGQGLYVRAMADDLSAMLGELFRVNRSGDCVAGRDFYEKGRTAALGTWIDVPYNAGNFSAWAGSWTVSSGSVITYHYTLIGKTLIVNFDLQNTSVDVATTALQLALPAGTTAAKRAEGFLWYQAGAVSALGYLFVEAGTAIFSLLRTDNAAFPAGSATVRGSITCAIL
jgi:hypothetical protein